MDFGTYVLVGIFSLAVPAAEESWISDVMVAVLGLWDGMEVGCCLWRFVAWVSIYLFILSGCGGKLYT